MLNPVTRICFGLAILFILWAAAAWFRASSANGDRALRQVQRAALPTGAALGLVGLGIAAMMAFGPWARPYSYSPELEGMTKRSGAPDVIE